MTNVVRTVNLLNTLEIYGENYEENYFTMFRLMRCMVP